MTEKRTEAAPFGDIDHVATPLGHITENGNALLVSFNVAAASRSLMVTARTRASSHTL
jgi:hypothetical protein